MINMIPWNKGKQYSLTIKNKMSESQKRYWANPDNRKRKSLQMKGHIPWNKGKKGVQKCSEETKKKLSILRKQYIKKNPNVVITNLGKKHTPETILKMRLKKLGKRHTQETKDKLHRLNIGKYHGSESVRWKGGLTPINTQIRNSPKYIHWRTGIFIRDNFTCQNCHKVGGNLECHHIKAFSKYPELRFDINNGITLCKECHKLTDNYCSKASNT